MDKMIHGGKMQQIKDLLSQASQLCDAMEQEEEAEPNEAQDEAAAGGAESKPSVKEMFAKKISEA